jgi:hypothetical protein
MNHRHSSFLANATATDTDKDVEDPRQQHEARELVLGHLLTLQTQRSTRVQNGKRTIGPQRTPPTCRYQTRHSHHHSRAKRPS